MPRARSRCFSWKLTSRRKTSDCGFNRESSPGVDVVLPVDADPLAPFRARRLVEAVCYDSQMTCGSSTALTSAVTVLTGVVVFVAGQLFLKFAIEPLQEQRRAIGRVAHALVFFQDLYMNPGVARPELNETASRALRDAACDLLAQTNGVPNYEMWETMNAVRPRSDVLKAHGHLIGLSNSVTKGHAEYNEVSRREICTLLGLRMT